MKPIQVRAVCALILLLSCGTGAFSQVIFSENFNGTTGGVQNGGQFQSGLPLRFAATHPGWTITGANAMHAVEITPGNFAPMLWSDDGSELNRNKLTLTTGVGANDAGVNYTVSFDLSPAVYQSGSQATLAGDQLRIQVLIPMAGEFWTIVGPPLVGAPRLAASASPTVKISTAIGINPADALVAAFSVAPGAWAGTMSFTAASFSYTGNGTGLVRYEISTANGLAGRFAGAVDNFSVTAVPEPSTLALLGASAGLLSLARRRRASR